MLYRMDFRERWIRWMEGSVFTSHMSILVNGSTSKDFKVERGLRQVDLISSFLFVLIMKALSGIMRKAIELGDFRGFKFKVEEEMNML